MQSTEEKIDEPPFLVLIPSEETTGMCNRTRPNYHSSLQQSIQTEEAREYLK